MANRQHNDTQSSADTNDLALAYLEEKYAEHFYYLAPWGDSMTGTREFLTTCDSFPDQPVLVQVENFKSDAPVCRDNYLAVKYQAETAAYFQCTAAEIFGDAIIHYEASNLCVSSDLGKDTSFDAFYQDPTAYMVVYVEIKGSNFTSQAQFAQFFSALNGSQGEIMVRVIVVNDENYGTLDADALNLLPYEGKAVADAFAMTENGSFRYEPSEEG